MGKLRSDERGFSAVEVILVLVIVVLIGAASFLVYKNQHKTTTASVATTTTTKPATTKTTAPTKTTTTTPNPYTGWTAGAISSEKLSFYYPSGWTLSNVSDADYLQLLQLKSSAGFTVTINALKPGSSAAYGGGSGGQASYNTTVGQSTLGGQTVYYLDYANASTGQYIGTELSSCSGAKKCLYQSSATGNDIEADISLPSGGAPAVFSPTSPTYLQAVQILKSITIQ